MKERKEIDRLFQERFKNFEAEPSPEVWAGIQDRLEKKKTRKVIPLWWKLSGVAAVLALLLILADLFFLSPQNSIDQPDNPVVTTKDITPDETDKRSLPGIQNREDKQNGLVKEEVENPESTTQEQSGDSNQNSSNSSQNEAIADNNKEHADSKNQNTSATDNEEQLADNKTLKDKDKRSKQSNNTKKAEALALQEKPANEEKNQNGEIISNETVAEADPERTNDQEKSLLDFVQNLDDKEETDDLAENQKAKRWALSPSVAPIYYNSFSGSGIDPQFSGSDKEGGINMSYGLMLSYEVSNKVTIRSGVNRIGLNYNTNNVQITAGLQGGSIESIDYASGSEILTVSSSPKNAAQEQVNNSQDVLEIPQRQSIPIGSLNQSLAYYEIPMEVEYALVEQKVGLHLIGGISTLVLDNNRINLNQDNFTTLLGSSNSLSDVSFSTNIGLGINYKFTEAIKFNLEPMFKYQLNAYRNTVSDFNPYYLGLYSGFSIRF